MTRQELLKRPFYLTEEQADWVMDSLNAMDTRQKVGQLFCVNGTSYSEEELLRLVREVSIGGVLFRPIYTKEELRRRLAELDEAAPWPLLKAANLEEGGSGAASDGTRYATQLGVAAANDPEEVTHFARVCAKEGIEAGYNWTFSPVADIDMNFMNPIINVRAYGSDRDRVMAYSGEYVREIQSAGMAACAKHFPGDGVDFRDQHLHPTYNTLSAPDWYDSFGKVYEHLIEKDILSIMTGHIVQPAVEREMNPALTDGELMPGSLSRELLTGVLRGRFGFNGVIASDATIMGGFCMAMERRKALPAAIMAGCDMLVFANDIREDIGFMLEGLENGLLTQVRLDEAVMRILALKARVAREPIPVPADVPAGDWAEQCADKAVTLVKNTAGILPITPGRYKRVRLICFGDDKMPGGSLKAAVTEALTEEGLSVEEYLPTFRDDLRSLGSIDRETLTLYICNMEAKSNNTSVHIYWFPKHALQIPRYMEAEDAVFVSFANPYHLQDIPRVRAYVNAYTASTAVVRAVMEKLFGRSPFRGVSPVDPFCGLPDTRL